MANPDFQSQLFSGYVEAHGLAIRREALTTSMRELSGGILNRLEVAGLVAIDSEESPVDAAALVGDDAAGYFENLAVRAQVDRRIAEIGAEISEHAVGHTVTVTALPEHSAGAIYDTYHSMGIYGSHQQEFTGKTLQKAVGTIEEVSPENNALLLRPIRFTKASMNFGSYYVKVLDEKDRPQVAIAERQPTLRDRPSRTGRVLRAAFAR